MKQSSLKKIPIRRTALLLAVLWTVMLGVSLAWNLWQENKAVLNQARSEARALFFKDQIYRRWAALHGGVYVPVTEYTPPSPFLVDIPERDITTPSGRRLTLMNPAYMTRQVQEMSGKQDGFYGRITSLRPIRPGNEPDSWEVKALQAFENGAAEISAVVEMDGVPCMRFMRPFYVEKGCLKCHAEQGYKVGDVRGGISVGVALDRYYALRKVQFISLSLWHLSIYLAGMIGIIFGVRVLGLRVRENEAISKKLDLDRQRMHSLLALSDFEASTEKELVDFALEEVVRLTESEVGYFHFYEEGTQTIRLFRWSRKVVAHCAVLGMESMYPLENVGIWADCIRTRQPVIHNDYGAGPDKKQLPEGHFAINRHMSVAVMDADRIVAISGVGNKVEPYDEVDVAQLTLFMEKAWAIIKDKRARAEIREKNEALLLFRKLIDQSYDAIFIVSTENGRFLDANERVCERLGYQREELLRLGVQDVDVGLPADFSWQAHIEQVRQKPSLLVESVHKRKDGSTFPVEINIRVIVQENDEYMVAAARDISERKAAEKELVKYREGLERLVEERTIKLAVQTEDLEKAQKAMQYLLEDVSLANTKLKELDQLKSMFIASMSHELRTPLNSVIGFSKVLANEWAGPVNDEQKKLLLTICRSGKHLLALINDVIDISKIESGKLDKYLEDFDLQEVVDEALEAVQKDLADKHLALTVESLPLVIHSDRRRLLQCLLNLLSNAIKFTIEGGVGIEMKMEDDLVLISVTDTGIGIAEKDMPLLFGSFVRLESPLKSSAPGTGLGLYLTKKLVRETLGGDISVESAEGVGSRFTLAIKKGSAIA